MPNRDDELPVPPAPVTIHDETQVSERYATALQQTVNALYSGQEARIFEATQRAAGMTAAEIYAQNVELSRIATQEWCPLRLRLVTPEEYIVQSRDRTNPVAEPVPEPEASAPYAAKPLTGWMASMLMSGQSLRVIESHRGYDDSSIRWPATSEEFTAIVEATERRHAEDNGREFIPARVGVASCILCSSSANGSFFNPKRGGRADVPNEDPYHPSVPESSRGPVCESCNERHFVEEVSGSIIRRRDAVCSVDEGSWAAHQYAHDHWYYCDWESEWYVDEDNVPSEPEPERDTDENGRIDYGADIFRYLSWPIETPKNGLAYGVELEMEAQDHASIDDVVDLLGIEDGIAVNRKFIVKADGSLKNEGAEVVTLPFTLDYHVNKFGWDKLLNDRLRRKAMSGAGTKSCGMHVHINKRALSALQIGKMLVFVNSPAMNGYMTTIAQRESGGYCLRDSSKKIKDGKYCSESRYDTLNVGDVTVEVRMFRGNLRPERVVKNIEFCDAMANYCKWVSMADVEKWPVFARWLLENRGRYPALVRYLHDAKVSEFRALKFGKPGAVAIPDAA